MTDQTPPADSTGYRIEVRGVGPCWLLGRGQTFPGRMHARIIETGEGFSISKRDIVDPSPEVSLWLDGYLAGQTPSYEEWQGVAHDLWHLEADESPEAWARYEAFAREFRETGNMPYPLGRRPTEPPTPEWADTAWVLVAGQVLGWNGTTWAPRDPQPAYRHGALIGSGCEGPGSHDSEVVRYGVVVCVRCGYWEWNLEWDESAESPANDGVSGDTI